MEEPIFISKINKTEILTNFGILLFVCVAMFFRSFNNQFNSKWFAGFLILIGLVWTISRFKILILYQKKLIIRRAFLTSKFDNVYEINKINHILFTFQNGRFGGNKMIVYTIFIDDYDIYSINLRSNEILFFIQKLENIDIKVINQLPK
jgi:hypothetical protein